jgi:hypothetical protein
MITRKEWSIPVSVRLSALSLALSGLLIALAFPWHPDIIRHPVGEAVRSFPAWTVVHIAGGLAAVLSLIGGIGLVAVHGGRLGRMGHAALLVTLVGAVATTALFAVEAVEFPMLAEQAPYLLAPGPLLSSWLLIGIGILWICWPVGILLLGIAAARARVYPVLAGWLLAVSGAAYVTLGLPFVPVAGQLAALAFGAAHVYWGWLLRRTARA